MLKLYPLQGKIAVVVDVLRATSCMITALANGVRQIQTFANADACLDMRRTGFIVAGERNGEMLEGFDLGNSPLSYLNEEYFGEKIAMTTTNGTHAIEESREAKEILIGGFINLSALANYLRSKDEDVVIVCAGWKGKVNMEDSLFAGALVNALNGHYHHGCDAPTMVESLYLSVDDLPGYLSNSSHVQRLKRLNIEKDIEFCLTMDKYDIVPVLRDEFIVRMR